MNLYYVVSYPNRQQTCPPCAREMSRVIRVTDGCQCANLRFAYAFNERPYDANLQIHFLVTDKNKLRIHRRGDHWSPHFKLFKLFSLIKQQPKQTTKPALFGKESCQRQLTERLTEQVP